MTEANLLTWGVGITADQNKYHLQEYSVYPKILQNVFALQEGKGPLEYLN